MSLVDRQCADQARERGDSPVGTTPNVGGWLLVEHPGAWGLDAAISALGEELAAEVYRRAHEAHCRVLMIRRPGRSRSADIGFHRVDRVTGRTRSGQVSNADELVEAPWQYLDPVERRLYLVCAHGRHDTCCARYGRPVAGLLAVLRPDDVYECSHVGGDRFAANLVSLPTGDMYGYVTPTDVGLVLEGIESDRPMWTKWRGRADLTQIEQAAVSFLGVDGLLEHAPSRADVRSEASEDATLVSVVTPTQVFALRIRTGLAPARFLTCRSGRESHARTFDITLLD